MERFVEADAIELVGNCMFCGLGLCREVAWLRDFSERVFEQFLMIFLCLETSASEILHVSRVEQLWGSGLVEPSLKM